MAAVPTFYADVLPILQKRCQECHREGGIGPMPLTTYKETRPWAQAIRANVIGRKMPPWFADSCCGTFSNDRSLSDAEIQTLADWAAGRAPAGVPAVPTGAATAGADNATIAHPDAMFQMPAAFAVPEKGAVDYQRFVIPTGFGENRWVQAVEVRPGAREVVHHVVAYIREAGETWIQGPSTSDLLVVYAPGSGVLTFPEGMAKLIPKGADLVLEMHYTPNGHAVKDRTSVAVAFAKKPPAQRVISLQLVRTDLHIPAGDRDYRITAWGTLPNDALLLGFFPHMHLRGKAFEYDRVSEDGRPEPLLRVSRYNFHWQLSYRLAKPILLKKGTKISVTAWYDNSANNPLNPDPEAEVTWGEQSTQEMLVGFFDVAVDPSVDRRSFFLRSRD
jgi:Copper type II ascorbate-dependent monooxygenase, C-terminal domain